MDDITNHIIANPSLANLRYELLIFLHPLEHSYATFSPLRVFEVWGYGKFWVLIWLLVSVLTSSTPEALLLPLLWPSDWSCYINLSHM